MSDSPPSAATRVLVVDDNSINRRLAMAFVKRLGFVVEEVEDGAAALERLAASPFDVVFLDISISPRQWLGLAVSLAGIFVAGMKSKEAVAAQEA